MAYTGYGPLLVGLLVMVAVLVWFIGIGRTLSKNNPIGTRADTYKSSEKDLTGIVTDADIPPVLVGGRKRAVAAGFGLGPRLAESLMQADLPLTASEYATIMLGAAVVGFLLGTVRFSLLVGLALAAAFGLMPLLYLQFTRGRRQRAFTTQLPDVLTLLVSALRAGYGLNQAMAVLVEQLPPPAGAEFGRVMRAIELGVPVQQALNEMAGRVGTDETVLVVTAIVVQHEMGGNLAQTLETIGETIRDRIQMKRQVQVLTAHQRLTGYILVAAPVVTALLLWVRNPEYLAQLFAPGWVRLMPIGAILMEIVGFFIMRRIVDIKV